MRFGDATWKSNDRHQSQEISPAPVLRTETTSIESKRSSRSKEKKWRRTVVHEFGGQQQRQEVGERDEIKINKSLDEAKLNG